MSQIDTNVLTIYNQFKNWGHNIKLDSATIIPLVTELIPAVQGLALGAHQGEYKKKIVLDVMELLINDSDLTDLEKNTLNLILNSTIPKIIDTMIAVAKGELDIGKLIKAPFKISDSLTKCCLIS